MKFLLICLIALFNGLVQAAVIEVDGSTCGLRDAISAAKNNTEVGGCSAGEPGEDVLNLSPDSIFSLVDTDPQLDSFGLEIRFTDLIIEGNGSIIERTVNSPEFGVLLVDNSRVTLNNLTIRNGNNPTNFGGGIVAIGSSAKLILNHVNVIDNVGGGVFVVNTSSVISRLMHKISNSRVANNYNSTSGGGAALMGAGLSLVSSNVLIENTTIDGNQTDSIGGGVRVIQSELFMINSTVSGNSSGGSGGGIAVSGGNNLIKIFGSTISNNIASESGGGINFNANGDVTVNPNNYFRIYTSLISGNTATISADEVNGPIDQAVLMNGYNIVGEDGFSGSDSIVFGFSDLVPTESLEQILLPLNNEIDFKKVHQLVENSPAIDFVPNPCVDDYDQIGNPRPLDGDNDNVFACDAGSIEYVSGLIYQNGFE